MLVLFCIQIVQTNNNEIVATPLWGKCEVTTHTPENGIWESFGTLENGTWESFETPKNLELDCTS